MKFHRALAIAALLLFGSPPAALSAELPDLGEAARAVFSAQEEARLGREIMRQIRADAAFLDDPEIDEYLNALGDRLAAANPDPARRFHFFAVRDPSINAFALPGGFIGVHTGLIAAARNESELAGVLAHEIAHVSQNHIARIVDAQKNTALTTLAALAVARIRAPARLATCTAAWPTPPAAAWINTVSPALSWASSSRP
jgi:predicted Zn-dependent protease